MYICYTSSGRLWGTAATLAEPLLRGLIEEVARDSNPEVDNSKVRAQSASTNESKECKRAQQGRNALTCGNLPHCGRLAIPIVKRRTSGKRRRTSPA
jgi:hypothetical protein